MVLEKFSSKNSKFYRQCMAHYLFCHTAISQFLMADISFNITCKELKIAQIAQLNQLFQLLHLVHIYGHRLNYELSRMLNCEEKCKQWMSAKIRLLIIVNLCKRMEKKRRQQIWMKSPLNERNAPASHTWTDTPDHYKRWTADWVSNTD